MTRLVLVSLVAVLVLPAAGAVAAPAPATTSTVAAASADVPSLLRQLKDAEATARLTPADLQAAYAAVLNGLLPGMADTDPAKRFAAMNDFSVLCLRAARPGAEVERNAICLAIVPKLGADTPPMVRAWLLRQLQWIGKAEVVPALTPILGDKDLMVRDCARRALEANPSAEAGAALRAAMPKADTEESLVGLINSLGARHDAAAVPAIAEAIQDKRIGVSLAAIESLGRIGTTDAAAALAKVQPGSNAALLTALQDAELRCGERLLAAGNKAAAGAIFTGLYTADKPLQVRVAALRGMVAAQGDRAISILTEILAGKDAKLQPYVLPLLVDMQGPDTAKAIASVLPSVPPAAQASLLEVLRGRADPATRPAIVAAMKSADGSVRVAATKALGAVGTAEDVPALVEAAASSDPLLRDAARNSLDHLPASANAALLAALDKVLPAALDTADAKVRPELIRTLAARRVAAALPALLKLTAAPDHETRMETLKGLEVSGDDTVIEKLASLTNKLASGEDERQAAEKALLAVCGRTANPKAAAETLVAAMPKADTLAKSSILGALRRTGGEKALAAVRGALKDSDATVQDAALRALAEWPDAAATDDLLAIAKNDPKETNQVLAIRGLVRVAGLADVPAARKVEVLGKALAAAKRTEDKKLVLGAAGTVKSIEALRLAAGLLADKDLKEEAALATIQIAKSLPSPLPAEVRPVLEKVVQVSVNDRTKRDAQDLLGKMPK